MNSEKEKPRENIERKGFWFERAPNGEKFLCFRSKVGSKKITIKVSRKDIEKGFAEA